MPNFFYFVVCLLNTASSIRVTGRQLAALPQDGRKRKWDPLEGEDSTAKRSRSAEAQDQPAVKTHTAVFENRLKDQVQIFHVQQGEETLMGVVEPGGTRSAGTTESLEGSSFLVKTLDGKFVCGFPVESPAGTLSFRILIKWDSKVKRYRYASGRFAKALDANANDEVCKDRNDQCASWAGLGECDKNVEFMHLDCRLSCGMCQEQRTISKTPCLFANHLKEQVQVFWARKDQEIFLGDVQPGGTQTYNSLAGKYFIVRRMDDSFVYKYRVTSTISQRFDIMEKEERWQQDSSLDDELDGTDEDDIEELTKAFGGMSIREDKIAALPASACPGGVGFITDIEGDLEWFQSIVGISKTLEWSGAPTDGMPGQHLTLKKGACFVFGGDLFDRGPGDIRLARELVHLKEEFPERVFLLVANRDLNKLRLASELSKACLALPANECTNAVYGKEKADADPLVKSLNLVDRVKWILKHTLSAGKTFDERRKELMVLNGGKDLDELGVAQSFVDLVSPPNGEIFRFLEKGQLGIRIGETLFVPGSIPPDALLFVPSLDLRYTDKGGNKEAVPGTYLPSDASLDTWLAQLNLFESDAMAAYKEKPIWETPLEPFGGESLLCYQSPSCVVSKAVVTESLYNRGAVQDSWGESAQYGKVADFLKKNGVKQFCTGGKPTGHMPLVTKVEEITVIMADTSYSDDSFYDVFIQPDGNFLVEGELHSDKEDGTKVSFSSADVEEGLIGQKSSGGFWVQGKTDKGYHLFKQVGRDKEYLFENAEEVKSRLKDKIAALPASACPGGVGFITDIEGDLDWFQSIVGISKTLEWSGAPTDGMPGQHLTLKKGACFVFGGDLFDRGPGDIRLARELVHLKEEFPDRVFLLVANRDLNKLRLASELSKACLAMPANECTNAVYGKEKADADPLVKSLNLVDRVKWILKHTLSAGKTFDERRKELMVLNGGKDVDDLGVAQSFVDLVSPPNGEIFRFLEKGQLGIRIGETLFVPGSIPPDALLFVPSLDLRYTDKGGNKEAVPGTYLPSDASLDTWLEQLNQFESDAMAAYKEKPVWETPLDLFGGESLLCYQSPSCVVSKAVVTESLYNRGTVQDSWGESAKYGKVADFLKKHGVTQFCTGGKPTGHMPLVTKVEEITMIMADTSYSDDSFYDVFIQPDGKFLIEGELHSDEEHGTKVSFGSADVDEGLIGMKTENGFWVQGKTEKGYHLFKQEGRNKEYNFEDDEKEVERLLNLDTKEVVEDADALSEEGDGKASDLVDGKEQENKSPRCHSWCDKCKIAFEIRDPRKRRTRLNRWASICYARVEKRPEILKEEIGKCKQDSTNLKLDVPKTHVAFICQDLDLLELEADKQSQNWK